MWINPLLCAQHNGRRRGTNSLRTFGEWEKRRQVVEKEAGWMILYILKSHRFKINKKHHMISWTLAEKNPFFSAFFKVTQFLFVYFFSSFCADRYRYRVGRGTVDTNSLISPDNDRFPYEYNLVGATGPASAFCRELISLASSFPCLFTYQRCDE